MRARRLVALVTVFAVLLSLSLLAQRRGRGGRGFFGGTAANVPYDGRFTFARVRYGGLGWGSTWWNHDYPDADRNLPLILDSLTAVSTRVDASNIFDLENAEIFRHPILYMWEPGYWSITDEGAANLGAYLRKGGFIIFDDFEADQWVNFEAQFARAMPGARWLRLDASHPIYHAFFDMDTIDVPHPSVDVVPAYYAVFADNDPSGRMLALANHNSDIAEYWEWSGRGLFPVDTTNDAYKLGVNYMVYGLTH